MADFFDKSGKFKTQGSSKKSAAMPDGLWQAVVVFNDKVRFGFKKKSLAYPFYCPVVFFTKEDALHYFPKFLDDLVKSGDIPQDAVAGKIDESRIKTLVQKLTIGLLERTDG